jgi:hypothetical protein
MTGDIARRLARMECMPPPPPHDGDAQLIRINGGLPDLLHATIGGRRFDAAPDELAAEFEDRMMDTAAAAGEPFVVISGPRRPYLDGMVGFR